MALKMNAAELKAFLLLEFVQEADEFEIIDLSAARLEVALLPDVWTWEWEPGRMGPGCSGGSDGT